MNSYLNRPLRTLRQAAIDCYETAIRNNDFHRAWWIAKHFDLDHYQLSKRHAA